MAIEQIRTVLLIALCVVSFLLWDAWQRDYGPKPPPPASADQPAPDAGPTDSASPSVDVPQAPQAVQAETTTAPSVQDRAGELGHGRKIRVTTDVLEVEIDTVGGTIAGVGLRSYPVSNDTPNEPFQLLDDSDPGRYFIAQSGLTGPRSAPNHHAQYEFDADAYELAYGTEFIDVPMRWRSADGVEVVRTYRFARDSYVVEIRVDVANRSDEAWQGALYGQLQRGEPESQGGLFRTYTYTGGVLSGPEKPYEKVDFSDMASQDVDRDVTGGWVAMIQHYFAAAWIPGSEVTNHYYSKSLANGRFAIGVVSPVGVVSPGGSGEFSVALYVGPKIQERMQDVAPHLERTVDYGWLWLIAEPLFWLLSWIHGFVANWGWAIIILTFLIKLAFFQLSATSYKSMARMRKLQPRITALRERYGCGQAAHESGNDGALSPGEDQSSWRMSPDPRPNPGVHRPVLGIARERGVAPGIVHRMARRPQPSRSVLRASGGDGRHHADSAKAQSDATRPDAGEDHDGAALRLHVLLPLLPVGTRALLVRQQHVVDHSAMGHHKEDRRQHLTNRRRPSGLAGP